MKWCFFKTKKKSGKWEGDKTPWETESVVFQQKVIQMGRDCQIHYEERI